MSRYSFFLILFVIIISSCSSQNSENSDSKFKKASIDKSYIKKNYKEDSLSLLKEERVKEISKVAKAYPNDSASIYSFYGKTTDTSSKQRLKEDIKNLKDLTSDKCIAQYKKVQKELKPLLRQIIQKKSLDQTDAINLVSMYSFYDELSGGALFSRFISVKENYDLVWKAFEIISKENTKDTFNIYSMINLNDSIRTNVELSEAMGEFVVQSIKKNPVGFIEMYNRSSHKDSFAKNAQPYESLDKVLLKEFEKISNSSKKKRYRTAASEILLALGDSI